MLFLCSLKFVGRCFLIALFMYFQNHLIYIMYFSTCYLCSLFYLWRKKKAPDWRLSSPHLYIIFSFPQLPPDSPKNSPYINELEGIPSWSSLTQFLVLFPLGACIWLWFYVYTMCFYLNKSKGITICCAHGGKMYKNWWGNNEGVISINWVKVDGKESVDFVCFVQGEH